LIQKFRDAVNDRGARGIFNEKISFDQLIREVSGPLNENRENIVLRAFKKMDSKT